MKISVIIPILNEAARIGDFLTHLSNIGPWHEIICVDGGSTDGSREKIALFKHVNLLGESTVTGRAKQMNYGALAATGDVLLFLHADCELMAGAYESILSAMANPHNVGGGFVKKYTTETVLLTFYRMLMNGVRTRLMKNLVGTNAIFVRRSIFQELGGYPVIPILEDVVLSDKMKKVGRVCVLRPHIVCSARRYEKAGRWARMWIAVKILFLFRVRRVPFDELKKVYERVRT